MRIIYIELTNFIAINKAMNIDRFSLSLENVDKPFIQLYGRNRCGKSVFIQNLHPFAKINLYGEERSDLPIVTKGLLGTKNIVYEHDGKVYNITHTYKPTKTSHSISSSIICDGEELNPSGGVTIFENIIHEVFGINKYIFQFIINGTNLTSIGKMGDTLRKTTLNKAMGIDIYNGIHRLAKDDYRYTNKIIGSLNNTKEYLLSTYGSYESLYELMNTKRIEYDALVNNVNESKSRLDKLSGMINVMKQQNVYQELNDVNRKCDMYDNVMREIGVYNDNMYTTLVDEQIKLNNDISTLKNNKLLIMKDLDILYDEQNDLQHAIDINRKTVNDYNDMKVLRDNLTKNIQNIDVANNVTSSSDYLLNMLNLAQVVNSTCKEIISVLSDKQLQMFVDMINKGIDISSFLMQESFSLMDSEKEKMTISHMRGIITSIDGKSYDCDKNDCIYKKTCNTLDMYFKSFQSSDENKLTRYDIEQFEHSYKNYCSLKRLLNMEFSNEIRDVFNLEIILMNMLRNQYGIDITIIKDLMEDAAKIEQRNKYIAQLNDVEKQISIMEQSMNCDNMKDGNVDIISNKIETFKNDIKKIDEDILYASQALSVNDKHRGMLSQIQNLNITDLRNQQLKLNKMMNDLQSSEREYNDLYNTYNGLVMRMKSVNDELSVLEKANNQYLDTTQEIENHKVNDHKYKVIAEATSSTKGKPVIAVREKVDNALLITNRLLNIMYDNEIEMLQPIIDETQFSLPFRVGCNTSPDIRYGSQSESTLLAFALSLSLVAYLTHYNIPLIDEIDAYLDDVMRDSFMLMLQEIVSTLKIEQCFLISHNIQPNQYEHIVHSINISDEITKFI